MSSQPKIFGPFVLARPLGFGGAGDVWLAVYGNPGQEKVCVVKRLHRSLRDEPELIKRFRHEADLVRRLTHGAIAQTFLVGAVDGEPFIAQEYVEGQDLAQLASRLATAQESVPTEIAVHIAAEVARALAYAHEFEGIALVHRDVSPENIRLAFTGEVKLIDFGIAKSAQRMFLTQVGHRPPGREMYMAPELLRGDRGDARADIFALGIVLWGLLAREPLPSADVATSTRLPPLRRSNPTVTTDFDKIIAKATAAAPADRYQTARDFQGALLELLPHGFNGEAAVHDLLGQLFDVERERERREEILSHARSLLPSVSTPPTGVAVDQEPAAMDTGSWERSGDVTPRKARRLGTVALVLSAVFVVGLFAWRSQNSSPPTTNPIASEPAPQAATSIAQSGSAAEPELVPAPQPEAPAAAVHERPRTSSSRPPQPRSDQLIAAGWAAIDDGETTKALELGRAALRAGGGPNARVLLGKAFLAAGRFDEAEREISRAAREDPSNTKIRHAAEDLRRLREDSQGEQGRGRSPFTTRLTINSL